MNIIRTIDRGGFGFVEEIETDTGERVARKTFDPVAANPADLPILRRRFEREVRIQSALAHPNIMPVLEHELHSDPSHFTMPLASESLETKIRHDHLAGTFDPSPWPDVLAAVEELHRLGYVHRDLKPANILLVGGTWMISDFGLILPTMRDTTILTGTNSAYGSYSYAAPEQAQDFRNTPAQADVFAMGCILHDALDSTPNRIPFTQIRTTGEYAPILEKCTEVDYRRRFPTVTALRAALFDLWAASAAPSSSLPDGDVLSSLLADSGSIDAWRRFLTHVEQQSNCADRDQFLRSLNSELLLELQGIDEVLFSRAIQLVCEWASSSGFEWSYCDVVGDRLLEAYRVANVRLRAIIVIAALELSVSHNRWHVMRQAGVMLGGTAENGLVERILIEAGIDTLIEGKFRRIEQAIHWPRSNWHEKLRDFLNDKDSA